MPHFESGGAGIGSPFSIIEFTCDKLFNEIGTAITDITFNWSLSGLPKRQDIMPNIGEMDCSLRSITVTGLNITDSITFTLTSSDGVSYAVKQLEVGFCNPVYVGLVTDAMPVENQILAMDKKIMLPESFRYDFIIDDKRTAIAFPYTFPALTDIKETVFGLSVLSEFEIYDSVYISTPFGVQQYRAYIYKSIQNTSGMSQPLNFIWQ